MHYFNLFLFLFLFIVFTGCQSIEPFRMPSSIDSTIETGAEPLDTAVLVTDPETDETETSGCEYECPFIAGIWKLETYDNGVIPFPPRNTEFEICGRFENDDSCRMFQVPYFDFVFRNPVNQGTDENGFETVRWDSRTSDPNHDVAFSDLSAGNLGSDGQPVPDTLIFEAYVMNSSRFTDQFTLVANRVRRR